MKNENYWKYAEKINGRLAMLGLVIGTINYGLFGWIALGFILKMKLITQFTTQKGRKTNDTRSRKI